MSSSISGNNLFMFMLYMNMNSMNQDSGDNRMPPPRPPLDESYGQGALQHPHPPPPRPPLHDLFNQDYSDSFCQDSFNSCYDEDEDESCHRPPHPFFSGGHGMRPFDDDGGKADNYSFDITGDPHFSVNGSVDGEGINTNFDNQDVGTRTQMKADGYQLDTTTEKWGGNENTAVVKQASVTTGYGRDSDKVTVDADGNLSINGKRKSLEEGKSLDLNHTSSIYRNTDGSYKVNSQSGNGSVSTTLKPVKNEKGNYMDIHVDANNVRSNGFVEKEAEKKTGK
jgi:hypothetical protein